MSPICAEVLSSLLPAGSFLGLGEGSPVVDAAIVTAIGAVAVAVLRGLALTLNRQVERERALYSEAFKAAMAWREMLYRTRRREDSDEAKRRLIERFHELQEEIDYFEGWTASEGRAIGRSYCRLVREVKQVSEPLIQAARDAPPRPALAPTPEDEDHPDVRRARERFLKDVRAQLSLLIFPRLGVWWRNREKANGTKEKTST